MESQLLSPDNMRVQARTRKLLYVLRSCKPAELEEYLQAGWTVVRKNKTSIRISRAKDHGTELEDRVWTLLYSMGFSRISGEGGISLTNGDIKNQIDVAAFDEEVALAIECKSLAVPSKRSNFQGDLGKFSLLRETFARSAKSVSSHIDSPRQLAFAMFLRNAILSDSERKRAVDANIVLFDSRDLEYYEQLTQYIGSAARFQFLADLMAAKRVPGLAITLPAIKSSMGQHTCYTFSISPEHLLKIAYVSHRAKGRASDVNAYQRMISKSRLRSIRSYIEDESNIFPTNIVLSFDSAQQFDKTKQEEGSTDTLGWLRLKPHYKSAWIIDGQHRLFAYAGSSRAHTSRLTVLAFENMSPDLQAELFININGEQRAVKKSLLQELYSELHWNAEDPKSRIKAVVAKAVKSLDEDLSSPFYRRIKSAEGAGSYSRSVSFGNFFSALNRSEFFSRKVRKGKEESPGAFWSSTNEKMLLRLTSVVNNWFGPIAEANSDWWNLGSAPGGGIAMNDSVTAIIMTLRSVIDHV